MNILKKLLSVIFLSFFLITPSYAADKSAEENKNESSRTLAKDSDTAKSKKFSGDEHQLSRSNIHNRKRSEDSRMSRSHLSKRSTVDNKNQNKTNDKKKTTTTETHNSKR